MNLIKNKKDRVAVVKTVSGLLINLSAAWYAALLIAPNFYGLANIANLIILISDCIFGTLCLVLTYKLERSLL